MSIESSNNNLETDNKSQLEQFDIDLNKAKSILDNFNKNNNEEYSRVLKEYQEAELKMLDSKDNIETLTQSNLDELRKEIQDIFNVSSLEKSYSFDENSNNVEKIKLDIDSFLLSTNSIADLSGKQIGRIFSIAHKLGGSYEKELAKKISNDPRGLEYLGNNWKGGNTTIDKYLRGYSGGELQGLVDRILNDIETNLYTSIKDKLKESNPGLSENKLDEKLDKVTEKIKELKSTPDKLFPYLAKVLGNIDLALEQSNILIAGEIFKSKTDLKEEVDLELLRKQEIALVKNKALKKTREKLNTEQKKSLDKILLDVIGTNKEDISTVELLQKASRKAIENGDKELIKLLYQTTNSIVEAVKEIENEYIEKDLNIEKPIIENLDEEYNIKTIEKGNNLSFSLESGKIIELSKNEVAKIPKEKLMSVLEFGEKLDNLGLGFVWNQRERFFLNIDEVNLVEGIDNSGLTQTLDYVLKSIGEEATGDLNNSYMKIEKINQISATNNTKNIDNRTNIEQIYWDKGYIKNGELEVGLLTKN